MNFKCSRGKNNISLVRCVISVKSSKSSLVRIQRILHDGEKICILCSLATRTKNSYLVFFLLHKRANDAVFDDFPKISDDFPKLFRRPDERFRTFSEDLRRFSEDYRRQPKKIRRCFDHTQQILVQWKGQKRNVIKYDIFTCEDIISSCEDISFLSIGHFRITFSLFLKASLGAHPFI